MTLQEQVVKLQSVLGNLKSSDQAFGASLIASFYKYKNLTPKQAPWIGKLIERATPAPVSAPIVQPQAEAVNVGNFAGVIALFNAAKAHLKFPKVRLVVGGTVTGIQVGGTKIVLSLNGPKSKAPGAVSITSEGKYGARSYYGKVTPEGVFQPAHATYGDFLTNLTALLTEFANNPTRVAKDHGKLTGNCCFCNKVLGLGEDKRSVLVGYGPVCADHYGLKAEWLSGVAKAEAKAEMAEVAAAEALPPMAVSPAAQETLDGLAESLQKATGAVKVTVTTVPGIPASALDVEHAQLNKAAFLEAQEAAAKKAEIEALAEELKEFDPDYVVKCYFCEQPATTTDTVDGFVVCPSCKQELEGQA